MIIRTGAKAQRDERAGDPGLRGSLRDGCRDKEERGGGIHQERPSACKESFELGV